MISKSERSYIHSGFLATPPLRADGRGLHDFRTVFVETGVAPLANGSARLSIGKNPHDGSGGTDILAAAKLEVITIDEHTTNSTNGRIACTVTCSPAAYPHLSTSALDDLQHDLTTILHETLAHPSLLPNNLTILPNKKAWLLALDLLILADAGNTHDALFLAARAALWDTRVPRTKAVEYKAPVGRGGGGMVGAGGGENMDVGKDRGGGEQQVSGFDTRGETSRAADFELPDYWDEGSILDGRMRWPICVTINLISPTYVLDATTMEEAAIPLRILLIFSMEYKHGAFLQGMRMLGIGDLSSNQLHSLLKEGEIHARAMFDALNAKLTDEDLRRNQRARDKFTHTR